MNSKVKQLIVDNAVQKINDQLFDGLMDLVHDSITDAMVDVLGETVDFNKSETFDIMMELCGRIAIVALPE